MSWDDGFPGARASRPHKAWHSLGHLPHLDQPGMAPWLSFGLADAVPAGRMAACSIARKPSGGQRGRMRAGRPRSQAMPSRRCGGGCLAGDFSESRRAPFGKLPFARESSPRPARRGGSYGVKQGCFRQGRPVDATGGAGYVTTAGRPPGNLGRSLLTPFPDPILSHSRHRAAVPGA